MNNRGNDHEGVFGELAHGVFHRRKTNHTVNEKEEQSSAGWHMCLTVRADPRQPRRLLCNPLMRTLNAGSGSVEVKVH